MQAQPPRHRPYDKHLRKQVVHLYWVAWSAQSLLDGSADVFARKTVQRIIQDYRVNRAVRVPQLEGLSPLPQKAWCSGCPAAGVYCAG